MDAVLGNLENVLGEATRGEIVAGARAIRKREKQDKILNSQNLRAATELGVARYVGESFRDRSACKKGIAHDAVADGPSNDPFHVLKKGPQGLKIFQPNPEAMMLDAVSHAGPGTYMFVASVLEHHSVTFLLEKLIAGRVPFGSPAYNLIWNDQYTDGRDVMVQNPTDPTKKVAVDDGSGKGVLGKRRQGIELIETLFFLSSSRKSDPRRNSFWAQEGAVDKANKDKKTKVEKEVVKQYNTHAWTDTPEGKAIRDKAEGQRCSNLASIKLWHVIPR